MVKHTIFKAAAIVAAGMTFSAVAAEEYDFEIGLDFDNASTDFYSTAIASGGVPMPSLGLSTGSGDSDTISLLGTWYFQGLGDVDGPKSQAAFLNRASSISFGYAYGDESSSSSSSGSLLPPRTMSGKTSIDAFNVDLRYVVPDSGWYGLAGVSRIDSDFSGVVNDFSFARSSDATAYKLGLGRYFGERTAVDLSVTRSDVNRSNVINTALSMTHIGNLGANWLYGANVGVAKSDEGFVDGTYDVSFSLFPSHDFEFGVGAMHQVLSRGPNRNAYEGFASWFIRDNIELSGRFEIEDADTFFGTDLDGDSVGVGVSVRF